MATKNPNREGRLISTAMVAGIGGRSVKTIEEWVKTDVLPPTDYVNDNFAVFDKEYIAAVTDAMKEGKDAVRTEVSRLQETGRPFWRLDTVPA